MDIEDNLSPNSVRKNVDQLISRLASSPSQSPKNVPQNQGDVPQNTENTSKNQRDVLKNQENVPKNHQNLPNIQGNVSDEEELFPKDTISDPPGNPENPGNLVFSHRLAKWLISGLLSYYHIAIKQKNVPKNMKRLCDVEKLCCESYLESHAI